MKVAVDECLPKRLCSALTGHDAVLIQQLGLGGLGDSELLAHLEGTVDAFITIDGNLTYQQNLASRRIGIIVLQAVSNTVEDLKPLTARILEALETLEPGAVVWIGDTASRAHRRNFTE